MTIIKFVRFLCGASNDTNYLYCSSFLLTSKKKDMKMTRYIIVALLLIVGFTSCKSESTEQASPEKVCTYSYNEGTTNLEWTAFKTNARVGVSGGFNEISVTSESYDDPKKVIESIKFSIKTSSVESNNEERNGKIAKHFFETINTPVINGKIKTLKTDGKAIIELEMNGIVMDIEGEYTLEEKAFNFHSLIDLGMWNAIQGVNSLNEVCYDLHKGEDGISKLWSEVELKLNTILKSECSK